MTEVAVNIEIKANISGNNSWHRKDIRIELRESNHWPITCHLSTRSRLKAMWNLTKREIKEGKKEEASNPKKTPWEPKWTKKIKKRGKETAKMYKYYTTRWYYIMGTWWFVTSCVHIHFLSETFRWWCL